MHGLGNDFVVVDDLGAEFDIDPDAVAWICDRHFGVGADGLILVRPASVPGADYFMLYYNADGTTAEMCGNGVRCFAKYLVDEGYLPPEVSAVTVQTLGGLRHIDFERDADGLMSSATVDMGEPALAPSLVPTTLPGDPAVSRAPLSTDAGDVAVTCVSMGNPHAVVWVDDPDTAPVESLGPAIETHAAFPNRTNVEFARVDGDRITLRVWERGVGETLACGTGACATVVAAVLDGLLSGRTATVELPGGELRVSWDDDGHVRMTGPAEEVFYGVIDMPADEDAEADGDAPRD
ncbi:MAG: diaminopimelate epimerase [Coriobacteriaceae bacterium]|nr:diaminopimelate epimerase [Coriobacteriaceae bacterium]